MSGAGERPRDLAFGTLSGFLAFGMGSGLAPFAPGTFGSLAALPVGLALVQLPAIAFGAVWIALFAVGVAVCGAASRRLGTGDPGAVVWDEMVALWLVLALVPAELSWWIAAFVLFRIFDIVKPWPIRTLERRFGGGFGIMLDDVLAAGYALAVLLPARAWLAA